MPVRPKDIHAALDRVTGSISQLAIKGEHPVALLVLAGKTIKTAERVRQAAILPSGLRKIEATDALTRIAPQLVKIERHRKAGNLVDVVQNSLIALAALPGGSKWKPKRKPPLDAIKVTLAKSPASPGTRTYAAALPGKSKWTPGRPKKTPK